MSEHAVRMPEEQVLTWRIQSARFLLRHEGVLRRFVHSVAGQPETGETLVAAWESACEDANRKLALPVDLAITRLLHAYTFPAVADILIPNRQVAEEAKAELRFLEETRA